MGNDAYHNMDADTKAAIEDNAMEQLAYELECASVGDFPVRLTDRQVWFIKCAIEARNIIIPLKPSQINSKVFEEDYGISQLEMLQEIECLRAKMKQAVRVPNKPSK